MSIICLLHHPRWHRWQPDAKVSLGAEVGEQLPSPNTALGSWHCGMCRACSSRASPGDPAERPRNLALKLRTRSILVVFIDCDSKSALRRTHFTHILFLFLAGGGSGGWLRTKALLCKALVCSKLQMYVLYPRVHSRMIRSSAYSKQ